MNNRENIRVLFVEDIPEDIIIAEEILKRESFNFISENTFDLGEVKRKLEEFKPHVVISDYNLPGFTALDVLKICKEYEPDILFIVLTGSINEEVAVQCLKSGADDYILKRHIKKLPFILRESLNKKKIEIEAKKEREILNTILTHNPVGVVLLDQDERIIFANDAYTKIFNVDKDEIKGRLCGDFVDKAYDRQGREVKSDECPIRRAYKQKISIINEEYYLKRKDGKEIAINVSIVPVIDEKGNILSSVVIYNDITEYKRVFDQLVQSQKLEAIGRLVGCIAHDFNNMLNAILGFSDLSLKLIDRESKIYRYIENVYNSGNRAKELISQLLSFCRKNVQKLEIINLNDLLKEIKNMIEKIIGEDIEIIYSFDENLYNIMADKTQMTQVIMNLLTNAKEAMPEGGKIYITTNNIKLTEQYYDIKMGDFVMLSVTDTGIGMSKEVMEHIFEPFFTTKEKGTGLGLATVYGIVKQNNGYIHVYSEVGQGTTFKIYLPSIEKTSIKAEQSEEPEPPGGNETILVVEDNDEVRSFIKNALEFKGYRVKDFANPLKVLEFFKNNSVKFDLLISDIVMPNMSGIALFEKLREINNDIKALFISGYPDLPQIEKELFNKKNFMSKPFVLNELFKRVREILDKS